MPAARKLASAPAAPEQASVPAAPELVAAPAVPELAAPVPESVPARPIFENQIAKPRLNDDGVAIERAFLSESPAQVVSVFRQGLRREATETQDRAALVVDREPTHPIPDPAPSAVEPQLMVQTVASEGVQHPDLAHSAAEPQAIDETIESESAVTATGSRRTRRTALLTLLLAATAIAGYYYYDRSSQQLAQRKSSGQLAPSVPDGPISAGATSPTVATQVDATPAPKNTTPQPATGAEEVDKAPSSGAPVAAKPRTDREPVPANPALADPMSASRPAAMPQAAGVSMSARPSPAIEAAVKTRRDPPIFKDCTEAVAALGFCSPSKQQAEK